MQKLLNSILRNGTLLLFIMLFSITLRLISKNSSFQRSKLLSINNAISGSLLKTRHHFFSYFKQTMHNQQLVEENKYLLSQFINAQNKALLLDSVPFEVIPAQVIRNSIQSNYNHLTLNAGGNKGIKQEMGVITAKGVVGVVNTINENTSGVISLLNKSLRINAKLKKSNHFGSMYWDGIASNNIVLSDVPLSATVAVGDTIVTGGMSAIFPVGIELGVVKDIVVPLNDNYYTLHISLFQDLSDLNHVYTVVFPNADEIKQIINDSDGK